VSLAAVLSACGATSVPRTIRATHVPTWAYDDGNAVDPCNGGGGAPPSLVEHWLTYAESNCGSESLTTKALTDCIRDGVTHCTPVAYVEANWNYAANPARNQGSCNPVVSPDQPETWWLHIPGTVAPGPENRLSTTATGGGNLVNQTTAAVRSWFQSYVRHCLRDYPALMMDDTGTAPSALLLDSVGSYAASSEIFSGSALVAAHQQMAEAMTHSDGSAYLQIDNGLSANNNLAAPFALLSHPSSVRGLVAEGAPMANGLITPDAADPPASDPVYYATLLDELAHVDNLGGNDFVVLLSYDRSGTVSARLMQQATEMLGYSGGHVVDWADLETGDAAAHDLAVWPEEGVVPTDPVESMQAPGGRGCLGGDGAVCTSAGHHDLEVRGTPGVYVREFRACYDRGVLFGACAAIANDTGNQYAVPSGWLTQDYRWQIGLSGGDVQSGGTVNIHGQAFTAGSTTIGPWSAMLLSGARGAS
jgi:hypothetical protein